MMDELQTITLILINGKNMRYCEIINWKELVNQFGLQDSGGIGLMSAKELSNCLKVEYNKDNSLNGFVTIPCNSKSEAVCMFKFIRSQGNHSYFEYQGTAN